MARRRASAKRLKKLKPQSIVLAIIIFIIAVAGYFVYNKFFKPQPIPPKGAISFHFMMLGNKNAGDCIYVRAGDNDILIDAGSSTDSIDDIHNYLKDKVLDNKLEYVIVTHAHDDHYAGFTKTNGSIFDLYECETIIDFSLTNQKETNSDGDRTQYGRYVDERQAEIDNGAVHYTALECWNNLNGAKRVYELAQDGNVKLEILYNYYYENQDKGDENNYSVCVQFAHGDGKFIFTGDLEEKGEKKLIENNSLSQVELYKAGHHGSETSSCEEFLSVIRPKMVVVPCCAGSIERPTVYERIFPSQQFIENISAHTQKVYVPLMIDLQYVENDTDTEADDYKNVGKYKELNGNIVVISDEKSVYAQCSNNQTILKDTEWFKEYRTTPTLWKSA